MIERRCAGQLPDKHHRALRGAKGELRYETCLTRDGFDGPYTISYHLGRPQAMSQLPLAEPPDSPVLLTRSLKRRHFHTDRTAPPRQAFGAAPRHVLLHSADCQVSVCRPELDDSSYSLNLFDELLYVQSGKGHVRSTLGDLFFEAGDYLHLPKGLIYRLLIEQRFNAHFLSLRFRHGVGIPDRFRTPSGQLRMDAPYCHRDFRHPVFEEPRDEGIRQLIVHGMGTQQPFQLKQSPLDVVGWDGSVYPWAFPIQKFQPRVASYHLPPTSHGTFGGPGYVVCSFVPRPLDFGPDAIPCPYAHTSTDMDEVLFYSRGDFSSRRGVRESSLTLHPAGVPHGPHPGKYETSVSHRHTDELAVMLDCTSPLQVTESALNLEDANYDASF